MNIKSELTISGVQKQSLGNVADGYTHTCVQFKSSAVDEPWVSVNIDRLPLEVFKELTDSEAGSILEGGYVLTIERK